MPIFATRTHEDHTGTCVFRRLEACRTGSSRYSDKKLPTLGSRQVNWRRASNPSGSHWKCTGRTVKLLKTGQTSPRHEVLCNTQCGNQEHRTNQCVGAQRRSTHWESSADCTQCATDNAAATTWSTRHAGWCCAIRRGLGRRPGSLKRRCLKRVHASIVVTIVLEI